jgi:arginine deiminase
MNPRVAMVMPSIANGRPAHWRVEGETDPLVDVLICSPTHLAAVPSSSISRCSLINGFTVALGEAMEQHRLLREALLRRHVRCHLMPTRPGMPDLCFARDAAVMTPWGLLGLRPAFHRRVEPLEVMQFAMSLGVDLMGMVKHGTVEGGDICIVRPGLVVIGYSGERTSPDGAMGVAALFRARGWEAILYRFDPHFVHLDGLFAAVTEDLALACVDVLDDAFLHALDRAGIRLLPVTYKEARRMACNILALGSRRLLTGQGNERVEEMLRAEDLVVEVLDIPQFRACGGGLHALVLPLARARNKQDFLP